MVDLFTTLFVVFLLAGLATLIKHGGAEGLIAGYNTASKEAQKYMAEKGIGKFTGNYLYLLAAIILAGYLAQKAGFPWGRDLSSALFTAVIIMMVIRARRFNPPGPPSRSSRLAFIAALIIVVMVAAGITWSALPPGFSFKGHELSISGAYGTGIKYGDIETVRLENKIAPITMRTNGLGLGPILKGHFQLESGDSVRLFLRSRRPPFVYIKLGSGSESVIINFSGPDQTIELYRELKSHVH